MAYIKTNWVKGDVVTSAKLNNIENGIKNIENHINYEIADPRGSVGRILVTKANDPNCLTEWIEFPNAKVIISTSAEEAAQIYALVEQLKLAADNATTKVAASGMPFSGSDFLSQLANHMASTNITPVIKMTGDSALANKYLSVYNADLSFGSFGYTEMSESVLYEIRFFVSVSSLIVRVTSCPYSIVGG